MVEPIVLDKYTGDTLLEDSGFEEDDELKRGPFLIGIHSLCRGQVRMQLISMTHKAIVCHDCCMRFLVPASVKTYRQLRSFFNAQNSGVSPGP